MIVRNQLTLMEARRLLDYRDGTLFWRHAGSGRRRDLRAVIDGDDRGIIKIGGAAYRAKYLVWNWHHGITPHSLVPANGDAADLRIENLREIEKIIAPVSSPSMPCPCCAQIVAVPSADIVAHSCGLSPMEEKILGAVWMGKGRAVQTERIFDRMYEDDPEGGPPPSRMYSTFKETLCAMRKKLEGSGVWIENVGRRAGYRLVLGVEKQS